MSDLTNNSSAPQVPVSFDEVMSTYYLAMEELKRKYCDNPQVVSVMIVGLRAELGKIVGDHLEANNDISWAQAYCALVDLVALMVQIMKDRSQRLETDLNRAAENPWAN